MSKLGVGETLDASFRIYRQHFGKIIGISALAAIPSAAVSWMLVKTLSPNPLNSVYAIMFRPVLHSPWAQPDYLGRVAGASLIDSLFGFLGMAAASVIILAVVRNEAPSFLKSLRDVGRALPSLLPAGIVYAALCLAGYVLCYVPGLIPKTLYALIAPSIMIEGSGAFASYGRSLKLTKGSRWAVFGVILVTTVIILILSTAISTILGLAVGFLRPRSFASASIRMTFALRAIGAVLATILLAPLQSIPRTVMFLRLRDEKEASEFEYSVDRLLERNQMDHAESTIQIDAGGTHQ